MKLYWKIIIISIIPLLLTLLLGFFRLEYILDFQQSSRTAADDLKVELLRSHFRSFRQERERSARILAGSKEAARALQAGDTSFLVSWSELFLDPLRSSRIFFTDMDGIVIARAHDPYRFGDDFADHPAFRLAVAGEEVNGIFELERELLILKITPVKLYGEIPVGAVTVGTPLSSALLAALSEGAGMGVEIEIEGFPPVTTGSFEGARSIVLQLPALSEEGLRVKRAVAFFTKDELGYDLATFQKNLLRTMLAVSFLLPFALFLLLRRYLRPFSLLVDDLTLLTGGSGDFDALRRKLAGAYRDANHEVSVIADALSKLMERVQETISLLEWTSRTDPLTRISNRLHLDSVLQNEMISAQESGEPLSVLIFDLDHFKRVNDDFGHQSGDRVLRRSGEILKSLAEDGFVGRWGGEEFLAVLPGMDLFQAYRFGERVREAVANEPFPIDRAVTISAGVAGMIPGDTPGSLVGRADRGLYEAKAAGRNRVVLKSG
jgi:diguanylate cyclase (GGDEF)-like protein